MGGDDDRNNAVVQCKRCGTCCRQGGPALHLDDLPLIEKKLLSFDQLVTIRLGEPAYDPLSGKVEPSRFEFIKIKGEGNSWSCLFFNQADNGCSIYRTRPLECRLLFCRDTGPLTDLIGKNLLSRQTLLPEDDPVLTLLERHEKECPCLQVDKLLTDAPEINEDIIRQLNELVARDLAVRDVFLRTFPARHAEELFFFGRPLFLVLAPYGFRLVENGSGVSLEQVSS